MKICGRGTQKKKHVKWASVRRFLGRAGGMRRELRWVRIATPPGSRLMLWHADSVAVFQTRQPRAEVKIAHLESHHTLKDGRLHSSGGSDWLDDAV